ncbi:hypothetical protein GF314_17340 [bacterium]|nr:hypothetical protein [bacterium]
MEQLEQARHLLFTVDGTYRPTTTAEMDEIKRLLDEAGAQATEGDARREHEHLNVHYQRLADRGWNGSSTAIGAGIVLTILMFLANNVDADGPVVPVGIYFLIGTVAYGISAFYPNYLTGGREKLDDLQPFGDEDDEKVTKADVRRAARKAAGQDTSLSDGFEAGQFMSKALFGLVLALILPLIAVYNFIRFWWLRK